MSELTGKRATAFRAAQVVRKRTVATRHIINTVCHMEAAGDERTKDLAAAEILAIDENRFGKTDGVGLHPRLGYVIGVDVEQRGVAVTIAAANLEPLRDRPLVKRKPDVERDAEGTLALVKEAVIEVVAQAEQECRMRADGSGEDAPPWTAARTARQKIIGIGMGLPGLVHRDTGVISSATHILHGWSKRAPANELSRSLEDVLPGVPVVVDNDASVGAMGIRTWELLRARGSVDVLEGVPRDLLYVRVGAGIGAGIVMNGELVTGSSGFAGEIGHLKVDDHGPLCPRCGQQGCVETKAAAPYVVRELRGVIEFDPNADTFARLIHNEHPACARMLASAGRYVGIALAHACTLLDPRHIYLGGLLAQSDDFMRAVRQAIEQTALRTGTLLGRTDDAESADGLVQRVAPELRARWFSPELLGALALVLERRGDAYIAGRIKESRIPAWSAGAGNGDA